MIPYDICRIYALRLVSLRYIDRRSSHTLGLVWLGVGGALARAWSLHTFVFCLLFWLKDLGDRSLFKKFATLIWLSAFLEHCSVSCSCCRSRHRWWSCAAACGSEPNPISENAPSGDRGQPSQAAAPATEAARNLVDHANETPVDRRLRRQQEQARNSGRKVCATWSTQHVELTPHPAGTRIGSGVNGPFWLLITRTRGSRALFRGGWLTRSCSRIGFQAGQMPDNGLSFQCLLAQDVGRWAISISCLQEAWLRMARCHVASGIQRPLVCCPTMHSNPAFVGRSWNEGDLLMHFESMQGVPLRLRHDSTGATSVTRWSAFCRRHRSFQRLWSLSFRAGVWTHFCMKATAFRLRSLSG